MVWIRQWSRRTQTLLRLMSERTWMLSLEHIASTNRSPCCNGNQIHRQKIQYGLDHHTVRTLGLSIAQRHFLQLPELQWKMSISWLGKVGERKNCGVEHGEIKVKMDSGIYTLKHDTTDRNLQWSRLCIPAGGHHDHRHIVLQSPNALERLVPH